MNFDLTEDQELFKATVERFVAPVNTEVRRTIRRGANGYDRARWSKLAELGLIALAADEAAGGMGGSMTDLAIIGEAIGVGNGPDPWLENGVLIAKLLAAGGAESDLPDMLDGSVLWAFAFAERAQRYNLAPRAVTAERKGDLFILSGDKTFVPGGAMADMLIVSADLGGEAALFCVPADVKGVYRRAYGAVDGSHVANLELRSVQLPEAALLPVSQHAFDAVIAEVRLLAAAEIVGLSQCLFTRTLDYVKQREQFGVAIGSFQALQHRLVECYAALEQSRSMLLRISLASRSNAADWSRQVAGAKAMIADNAMLIGREAVQMHGGMGITDELAIGHAFKRVLLLEKLFGDNAANLSHYAEAA